MRPGVAPILAPVARPATIIVVARPVATVAPIAVPVSAARLFTNPVQHGVARTLRTLHPLDRSHLFSLFYTANLDGLVPIDPPNLPGRLVPLGLTLDLRPGLSLLGPIHAPRAYWTIGLVVCVAPLGALRPVLGLVLALAPLRLAPQTINEAALAR
jgi:hypothetical protein